MPESDTAEQSVDKVEVEIEDEVEDKVSVEDDDEDEDAEPTIDPSFASMMGFTSFGSSHTYSHDRARKKQKLEHSTGANNTPLAPFTNIQSRKDINTEIIITSQHAKTEGRGSKDGSSRPDDGNTEPQDERSTRTGRGDYRHGVKNERGDVVVFMDSFLEDPWKDFRPGQDTLKSGHT